MKKVFYITDNYDGCYGDSTKQMFIDNWAEWNVELIFHEEDDFIFRSDVEYVLIDYGFVDNQKNMDVIKQFYLAGIPILWTGGLGGSGHYPNDCKKMFPKDKWAHKIPSYDLGHVMHHVTTFLDGSEDDE